jgi:hypothetical protein
MLLNNKDPRQSYARENQYILCNLCNKKFTKINYESHLPECKQKNDKNNNRLNQNNKPLPKYGAYTGGVRQPTMPAVMYGGGYASNRPNFNVKFSFK